MIFHYLTHFSLVLTKRRGCKGQSIEGVIEDGQVVPIVHSGDPTIEMCNHKPTNNNTITITISVLEAKSSKTKIPSKVS